MTYLFIYEMNQSKVCVSAMEVFYADIQLQKKGRAECDNMAAPKTIYITGNMYMFI